MLWESDLYDELKSDSKNLNARIRVLMREFKWKSRDDVKDWLAKFRQVNIRTNVSDRARATWLPNIGAKTIKHLEEKVNA